MPNRPITAAILAGALAALLLPPRALACSPQDATQHQDYLTDAEAEELRDAATPGERIRLYLSFAEDRLKKFEAEVNRTAPEPHRDDVLNGLLNDYVGSVDDGADEIETAQDENSDIRKDLKLLIAKDTDFLAALEKYDASGPGLAIYKDTLDDAIDGTKDAISDAEDALKPAAPSAPARGKP